LSSDKDIILGRLNAMAQIVTAHLATTKVETDQLPDLVRRLYASLSEEQPVPNTTGLGASRKTSNVPSPPEKPEPSATVDETPAEATSPTILTVEKQKQPAVPIKESVFPDYIICLEDGKQLKSLKRHLAAAFDMTIEDYKAKWGLPEEYPTVAPNYTEMRRQVAQKIGLGKRASQNNDTTNRTDASTPSAPGKQSPTRNKAKAGPKERAARKADEHRLANAFSR